MNVAGRRRGLLSMPTANTWASIAWRLAPRLINETSGALRLPRQNESQGAQRLAYDASTHATVLCGAIRGSTVLQAPTY